EARSRPEGEQRSEGNAHERVQGVPDKIERGNFVREKLDGKQRKRNTYYPPVRNRMKRTRQGQNASMCQQPHRCDGRVNVQSGSEAGGNDQGGEFGSCEMDAHRGRGLERI